MDDDLTPTDEGRLAGRAADDHTAVDPRVDAVLEALAGLADLPVEEHAAVYEQIHAGLRDVLSGTDDSVEA